MFSTSPLLVNLTLYTTLIVYIVTVELLFGLSKEEFLMGVSLSEKARLFAGMGGLFLLFALAAVLMLSALAWAARTCFNRKWSQSVFNCVSAVPFVLFAVCNYVYLDRWTYNVLSHSMLDRRLPINMLVFAFFVLGGVLLARERARDVATWVTRKRAGVSLFCGIAILVSVLAVTLNMYGTLRAATAGLNLGGALPRPNIVLLTYDGLQGDIDRDNTPNLYRRRSDFHVFTNAMAVGHESRSGIVSLMTGKSPATHGTFGRGRLSGRDAFEHMPLVLRRLGYYTVNLSAEPYTNPDEYGMRDGFDEVNNRVVGRRLNFIEGQAPELASFVGEVLRDYSLRLRYTLSLDSELASRRDMALISYQNNEFETFFGALERLAKTTAGPPYFFHFHNTITHRPIDPRSLTVRKFSAGVSDDPSLLYKDAVHQMDLEIERIITTLERYGKYRRSIFILTTDHESGSGITGGPVTLLIHLPGQTKGNVHPKRVSLLDVAPTITDYLGQGRLKGFEGLSLLDYIEDGSNYDDDSRTFHTFAPSKAVYLNGEHRLLKGYDHTTYEEEWRDHYVNPKDGSGVFRILDPDQDDEHRRAFESLHEESDRIMGRYRRLHLRKVNEP